MTTVEIIELILGSGGLIGICIVIFRMGKIVQNIETLDENCKKNFSEMRADIKEIRQGINVIEVQIGKLETRVEERTLRVVQPNYEKEPAVH